MKQVAVIVVLAQIGCFLPCERAIIPIRDRVMTRVGGNDDMETNSSTFSTEMKELGFLLRYATSSSLILLDELGRSSSLIDGIIFACYLSCFNEGLNCE